jgi:hypothetical protein
VSVYKDIALAISPYDKRISCAAVLNNIVLKLLSLFRRQSRDVSSKNVIDRDAADRLH